MSSKRLKIGRKPCKCPEDNFQWVEKTFISQEGPLLKTHSYQIFECTFHHKSWGKRRNEIIKTYCESPIENYRLNTTEIDFLKAIFPQLWDGKLTINKWQKSLEKFISSEECDDQTKVLIQAGLVYTEETIYQSKNWQRTKVFLTEKGRSFLKRQFRFKTSEEIIQDCKLLILQTFNEMKDVDLSSIQRKLKSILETELKNIERGDAGIFRSNKNRILPSRSLKKRPTYEIIIRTLCSWLKIWKPILTVRELSARALKDIALSYSIDPSKLLEKHLNDLRDVIDYYCGLSLDSFGLMHLLKFFIYAGNLNLHVPNIKGQVFRTLTNYYLSKSTNDNIATQASYLICIENLSAFFHVAEYARQKKPEEYFIVYIGGKTDEFLPSVILQLIQHSNFKQVFFWCDNDLGGLQIFEFYLNFFSNHQKIPENLSALYKIPPKFLKHVYNKGQDEKIKKIAEKTNFSILKQIADYIITTGYIEQEVFLSNFEEFLEYNIHPR